METPDRGCTPTNSNLLLIKHSGIYFYATHSGLPCRMASEKEWVTLTQLCEKGIHEIPEQIIDTVVTIAQAIKNRLQIEKKLIDTPFIGSIRRKFQKNELPMSAHDAGTQQAIVHALPERYYYATDQYHNPIEDYVASPVCNKIYQLFQ